jgi:phage shock protein PspC (stress-responsive transcriptional regulator)
MSKKLQRYPQKGYVGGVCHGLGEHTGIDPILWRTLMVFFLGGIVYLALWVVLKKGE